MGMKALANISARNDTLNKFKVNDVDSGIMHVLIPKPNYRQLYLLFWYSLNARIPCMYHMNYTYYLLSLVFITHNIRKPKAIFFYLNDGIVAHFRHFYFLFYINRIRCFIPLGKYFIAHLPSTALLANWFCMLNKIFLIQNENKIT